MWDDYKKNLILLIDRLTLLPVVVCSMAVDYLAPVQWENQPRQTWVLPKGSSPRGIASDGTHLFVCDEPKDYVLQYSLDGKLIEGWKKSSVEKTYPPKSLFVYPKGIDVQNGVLYVVDWTNLKTINFKKEILSSCILPFSSIGGQALRVDGDNAYVTIAGRNQVFVYSKYYGNLNFKLGNEREGSGHGEFCRPYGVTFDLRFLYVVDSGNKRIQVFFKKDNFKYSHQWGGSKIFNNPICCYHHEGIIYVGDTGSIQLFTPEGFVLQKMSSDQEGHFAYRDIADLLVTRNRMFVSDRGNDRIHVFRNIKSDKSDKSPKKSEKQSAKA